MEKESIRFEPDPETITGTGKYGYDEKDGKKPLPYAIAEFTDNSLSATAKQKSRNIVVYIIFGSTGNNYVVIRDNGNGMDTQGLKSWATFALSPANRGITSEFVGKTPVGSLTSEISSFGVGSKQAAFYIARSIKMISKQKDSPNVLELCLDKRELRYRADHGLPVYVDDVTKRAVGDTCNLTSQQAKCQTLVDLIRSEKNYYESFSTVILSDVRKKHLGDKTTPLKKKREMVKELASQLASVYYYYLNPAIPEKDILERPASPPCMYMVVYDENNNNLDTEYKSSSLKYQKFVFKHPTKFFKLRDVDSRERQLVEAAKDHFKFQLNVDNKRQVDVILRYYPTHEEAIMKKIQNMQGFETTDDDDTDSETSYFEFFWQGRLIPYSTAKITSLTYLKPKASSTTQTDQILSNCVNRLSGQLFFDHQFSVSREKLRILEDIEHMFSDKSRVMMMERSNEGALRQWLASCERHNQEFDFGKEKNGQYHELTVKNPSIKLKAGDHLRMTKGKHAQLWRVMYFEKPKTKSLGKLFCRREPIDLFPKDIGKPLLMLVQKKPNLIKLTDQEATAELASIRKKLPSMIEIKMEGKEILENANKNLTAGAGQIFVQLRVKDGDNNPVRSMYGSMVVQGNSKTPFPEIKQIIKMPGKTDGGTTWGSENKPADDDTWNLKLSEEFNTVGTYTIIHQLVAFPEVKHTFYIRVTAGNPVMIQVDDNIQKHLFQFNTRAIPRFACQLCDAFGNVIKDHSLLKRVAKTLEFVSDKLNITFSAMAVQDSIELSKVNIELKEQALKNMLKPNPNKRKATAPPMIDLEEDVFDLDLPTSLFGVDISKAKVNNDNQAPAYVNLEDELAEVVDPADISTNTVHLFDATVQLKANDLDFNMSTRKIQLQVLTGPPTTIRIIEPRQPYLTAENHTTLQQKLHLIVIDSNGLAATVDKPNQTFFIEVSCPHIKKKQFELTSPSLVIPPQDILFEGKLTGVTSTDLSIALKGPNRTVIYCAVIPLTLQPSSRAVKLELIADKITLQQEPDTDDSPVYFATVTADNQLDFSLLVKNELGQQVRKQQMMVKGLHSNVFKPLKSDGKLGTFIAPQSAKPETYTISYKDADNTKLSCILKLYLQPKCPVKWTLEIPKKLAEGFTVSIGSYFPQMNILAFDEFNNLVPHALWQQQPLAKINHDTEPSYPLSPTEIEQLTQGAFTYSGKVGMYTLILYGGSLAESAVKFAVAPGDPDHLVLNCPAPEISMGMDTGREINLAIGRHACISLIQVNVCDKQGNILDLKNKLKPRLKLLNSSRNLEIVHENISYHQNCVLIEDLAMVAVPGKYQLQIADTANHCIKSAILNLEVNDYSDKLADMSLSFLLDSHTNYVSCTSKWPILRVQLAFDSPSNNMVIPSANSLMLNLQHTAELPYMSEPILSQTEPYTYFFNIDQRWQDKPVTTAGQVKFEVVYTEQRNLRNALKPPDRKTKRYIELVVVPDTASRIEIEDFPGSVPDKFVSNANHNRYLFDYPIIIIVKDKFDNTLQQHNIDYIDLVIRKEDQLGSEQDYPQLDGNYRCPFSEGKCAIGKIGLKADVGSLEGSYILSMVPVSKEPTGTSPICVRFNFHKQMQPKRQQQNQEQSRLAVQLEAYLQNKASLESKLQQKILGGRSIEINPDQLQRDIQAVIEELKLKKAKMADVQRVLAKVPDIRPVDVLPNHLKSDIVGWIALQGTVPNANLVRILSYQMSRAMKTYLVKTTEAKQVLYREGIAALSLDTLVHRSDSNPVRSSDPGSPRLAADLISCTDEMRNLWRSQLRNAVVVDTNNDAMLYQQHLASIKKFPPMILSLEGGRFDTSGIADPSDKTPQDLHQIRYFLGTTPASQTPEYKRIENEINRLEDEDLGVQIGQLQSIIGSIINLQNALGLTPMLIAENIQHKDLIQIRQDNPSQQQFQQQSYGQQHQYNAQYGQPYYSHQHNNNGYNNNGYNNNNNHYSNNNNTSHHDRSDRAKRPRV